MLILNNLFPVFALIGLGALLRHIQLTTEGFLKAVDRLVYFIFFPAMLFWKIGSAPSLDRTALDLILAAVCAVVTVYLISAVCLKLFRVSNFLAGMAYALFIGTFPVFLDNTFHLGSMVTLPLALLCIDGTVTLGCLGDHLGHALLSAVVKLLILPIVGWFFLGLFGAEPLSMQVGVFFFALPTSSAIIVLSSQLNSDTEFASAAILLSTLLSFFSLSAMLLLF